MDFLASGIADDGSALNLKFGAQRMVDAVTEARMSASNCLVEACAPRCSCLRAGSANQRSTWLIREAGVGVKWA